MNPNLSTVYEATRADRDRLTAQAERGWQAEHVGTSGPNRSLSTTLRQWTGTLLIQGGERLRGTRRQIQAPASYAQGFIHYPTEF